MNCISCTYAQKELMQNGLIGETQTICTYNPPTTQLIPTAQGITALTIFPTVSEKMHCSKYRLKVE